MRVLDCVVSDPETCAYLPDRTARLEYRIAVGVAPETMDRLLERGWRRFGFAYFRPACDGCMECVSLRIPVDRFRPSRAQRRAAREGAKLLAAFGAPVVDPSRLDLLRRWHREREATRGWRRQEIDPERYELEFAAPNPCARELSWWDPSPEPAPGSPDGNVHARLVAVSLVDETPNAYSAIYTFYDPAYARYSPGTLSILELVAMARARGKSWVYLGYRIEGCVSSEYKSKFEPHELAVGWPDLGEDPPDWRSS